RGARQRRGAGEFQPLVQEDRLLGGLFGGEPHGIILADHGAGAEADQVESGGQRDGDLPEVVFQRHGLEVAVEELDLGPPVAGRDDQGQRAGSRVRGGHRRPPRRRGPASSSSGARPAPSAPRSRRASGGGKYRRNFLSPPPFIGSGGRLSGNGAIP